MGKKLGDRFEELGPRSKAYDFYCNFVVPWAHKLSKTEPLNREAFSLALDTGDLPFAGFIANHRAYNTFYMGLPLAQVFDESTRYLRFCNKISHNYAFDCVQGVLWAIEYLQNEEGTITELPDGREEFISRARAPESPFPVSRFLILLMQIYVLEGNAEKAWKLAMETENLQEHVAGTISSAEYRYYRILSGLMYCAKLEKHDQERLLQQLKEESLFFTEWAKRNPHTFAHKNHLISAEIAVLEGNVNDALSQFDLAIINSRKSGFNHDEALACERAVEFWKSQGRERLMQPYIQEAFSAHRKWGCHRRMSVLKKQYQKFLFASPAGSISTLNTRETTRQYSHRDIGLGELLRSVAVISEARNLEQLNKSALKLLMQGGGADIGALFISTDREPRLATYAFVEDQNIKVQFADSISIENACDTHNIPFVLLEAAKTRREPVIVNSYEDFSKLHQNDRNLIQSEFRENYPRSMSCLPVLRQGKLSGLVYLGNSVTEHAFSHDRLQVMKALSGQLSVSIENVMVYEDLENLVLRRTKALETANSELKRLSNMDGLTGLYNRRYFDQALEMEIDRAHRSNSSLSLLMCDIDFFKNYNDYYGHVAGDQCIRAVAEILLENCQRSTDIAARYGGEEFALILPNSTREGALAVANRCNLMIAARKIAHRDSAVKDIVSLSTGGVSLVPRQGCTTQQFVSYADEALYESKNNGRDRVTIKNI
jgi:diguanylate cyclase (GGDEF)-like protein